MISVIVPVFNAEKYLRKCLDSIMGQTLRDLEIILVDDGSCDESGGICDEYARRDQRIRVLHKENEGVVRARKDGLKKASGEEIAYVDADDWIRPDMLERMHGVMGREGVDVVACGRRIEQAGLSVPVKSVFPAGRYGREGLERLIYPRMIAGGGFFSWGMFPNLWDKLFRRDCLEKYQMAVDDRLAMGEDAACLYPVLLHADSLYIMEECFYHYRQSAFSMVRQTGDAASERERFRILYRSVAGQLERDKSIYDLRGQWLKYMLFLMVPRADILYDGFGRLEYLFPYPRIRRGHRVVLYCAGVYGQRLYRYIKESGFCRAVALADQNAEGLRAEGLTVIPPQEIGQKKFDAIIIANSFEKFRRDIYEGLARVYPKEMLHVMDEDLVFSGETKEAFGL